MKKLVFMRGLGWKTPQPIGGRWDEDRKILWLRVPWAQIGLRLDRRAW